MLALLLIILGPLVAAAVIALVQRRLSEGQLGLVLASGMGVSLIAAIMTLWSAVGGEPATLNWPWAAPLGPDFNLRGDAWGSMMACVVSFVGIAIGIYTPAYLHGDTGLPRLLARLGLFATAMQLLVLADDLFLVFVAWEITSVTSYLLVGHTRSADARKAATTAILVTGLGGLVLLGGICLLTHMAGTASLHELGQIDIRDHALYDLTVTLMVIGCATKSALFPFHFWLPGAMAAPTPISAYLHSATMVKAGIFLLARLHPSLGGTEMWELLLGTAGGMTVLIAIARLPSADDLKQLAALSTLLALGTLGLLLSFDTTTAIQAAAVFLLAHAGYKGTTFLVIGSIDHGTGTRLMSRLRGLRSAMPFTAGITIIGAASMAGLPPFAGFIAKDQVKLVGYGANWFPSTAFMLGACALVAVACWLVIWPFFRRGQSDIDHPPHESGAAMLVPAGMLALAGAILGPLGPWMLSPVLQQIGADLTGPAEVPGVSPFPGNPSKALASTVVIIIGVVAAFLRTPWAAIGRLISRGWCAWGWDHLVNGGVAAGRVTVRILQHGDLRVYIATTWIVLIGFLAWSWDGRLPRTVNDPLQAWIVPPVILAIVGALGTVLSKTRLAAIAGLGAVGISLTMILIAFSAPDAALTLVVAEILTVVLLTLAFRGLPDAVDDPDLRPARQSVNLIIAVAVGLVAGVLVLMANATQMSPHLGYQILPQSLPAGKGANAVNVILVDFRALDTFAEIAVLAIAGMGVTALLTTGAMQRSTVLRSPALMSIGRLLWPLALVLAALLFWRGHNQPGGGFAAGLVVGAAIMLLTATSGAEAMRRALPIRFPLLVGGGLMIAFASGLPGAIGGTGYMAPMWLPAFAGIKLGTPLLFDLGVMFLVVGMAGSVTTLLASAEEDRT